MPFFSIILPTYGRGEHIRPTIQCVLRQTFSDFELIVVGDGCRDETAQVVDSFESTRVSWYNLEQNSGSQSAPNNLGIAKATGKWVAYIGHDDIWSPTHLATLHNLIKADRELDFVVSGCIYYGPERSEIYYVTGMFDDEGAQFEHFFPPSSLAHRREITGLIGDWRDPRIVAAPVDCEFLLRAAHAGLRFSSTKEITVHKFAAGQRYLSYLRPSSDEQWNALHNAQVNNPDYLAAIIKKSRRQGHYMTAGYRDFSQFENGQLYDQNRSNKGILRPPLKELSSTVVIEQTGEPRALDWYALEKGNCPFRWSGPNPKPRILIPFTYAGRVRMTLLTPGVAVPPISNVSFEINGEGTDYSIGETEGGVTTVMFQAILKESDYSILTVYTPDMACPHDKVGNGDFRLLGIAVGDIVIEPMNTWG
jgi:glycosyltransferase involved in cell wall biosynthesis